MSGSLEHRTFRYHYATLKAGLGRSLNVDKAYARELITREERDDAKSGRTLDEQNGKFLDMVELRIIDNPRKYYDFLKILKEEAAFANLVDKLTTTFREYSESVAKATAGNGVPGKAASTSKATKKPTLDELIHNVKTTEWFKLGLKLGVKKFDLEVIEKNKHLDIEGGLEAMLRKWLRSSKDPTWKAVVEALRQLDEEELAQELETQFC